MVAQVFEDKVLLLVVAVVVVGGVVGVDGVVGVVVVVAAVVAAVVGEEWEERWVVRDETTTCRTESQERIEKTRWG